MAQQAFFDGVLTLARATSADRARVLLKAATELFVEAPDHTRSEIAVYEELTLQLLKVAPIEDRRHIARLIAHQADAPPAVIRSLLHDDFSVGEVLIVHSPHLGEVDLLALIATGTDRHLELIAGRADLPSIVVEALVRNMRPENLPILLANHAARIPETAKPVVMEAARSNPVVARALSRRHEDIDDTELTELFLDLDSKGRRRVIQALEIIALRDFAARRPMPNRPIPDPEVAAAVAKAALSRDVSLMSAHLADLLSIDRAMARALLTDQGGEPLAIALKASGLAEPLAARIILFSGAEDTRGYMEVKRLVELYETVSLRSSLLLVAHWRGENVMLPRQRNPQPQAEAGASPRGARPAARPEAMAPPAAAQQKRA